MTELNKILGYTIIGPTVMFWCSLIRAIDPYSVGSDSINWSEEDKQKLQRYADAVLR